MTFRQLNAARILDTLEALRLRIEERFPGAGLAGVAHDLAALGRQCAMEAESLGRPILPLRVAVGVLTIVMVVTAAAVISAPWIALGIPRQFSSIGEYVQAVEAAVQELVFLGIAIFFLFTLETRQKRRRALKSLHELRSIAHIVDMHQLTKDPERISSTQPNTKSSPDRHMTADQLGRYLDYCSEMLSLTSKIAALYVQNFDDAVTLAAVNEVESLTMGLSRKIWQKISVIRQDAIGRQDQIARGALA